MTEPESTADETVAPETETETETETEVDVVAETEVLEATPADEATIEDAAAEPDGAGARRPAWARDRLPLVLTAGLLVLSALVTAAVGWFVARPDHLTDADARDQLLAAAQEGAEAVLTYSPETVDKNVAEAKSRLTGDFLQKYTEFADTVVTPAAKERGIKTEANVARSAVSQMQPDSAQVLAFVNQVTTSKERPAPALSTSSVMMTLVRQDGRWLISQFNPV